ncbi:Transcriptional regulatory protein RcsB [compost metagenome]
MLSQEVAERVDSLSAREIEVLRYFLSGMTVSDIAGILNRSVKTISTHKISAMRKLGVETDHALVMFGLCHDLLG